MVFSEIEPQISQNVIENSNKREDAFIELQILFSYIKIFLVSNVPF